MNTALYIHWPYCLSKCPYCDFNSHVPTGRIAQDKWLAAYIRESAWYAGNKKYTSPLAASSNPPPLAGGVGGGVLPTKQGAERREHFTSQSLTPNPQPLQETPPPTPPASGGGLEKITSIFFGGGTPSLMEPALVAELLAAIRAQFDVAEDVEITLEANPTSVEAAKFKAFAQAGINRVSIGVQSLRPHALKFLGREHDVDAARRAITLARETFPRYSFDLIYARPQQTLEDWREELREALTLAGSHLSLYQLTIEKGTPFYAAYQKKAWELPEPEVSADMYELTREMLSAHGLQPYEISNYAKAGEESRHNMAYWRYQPYIGIGPGAHGRLHEDGSVTATMTIHHPDNWLKQVMEREHGLQSSEVLSQEDRLVEMLMMGLRLQEGIPRARFMAMFGQQPEALLNAGKLAMMMQENLLKLDATTLKLTEAGRMLHQRIVGELLV